MASGHADVRVVVPEGAAAPATVPPGILASAADAYRSGQRLDMQSLARQAGVGRATLYRRVGNREQLHDEVIWWRARRLLVHQVPSTWCTAGSRRWEDLTVAAEQAVRVSLELGKRWVFATALDWPGWCRRGKGEQAAIDTLLGYAGRYAAVAGPGFEPGEIRVVGHVTGTAITDFGAPDVPGPWDDEPLEPGEADRLTGLLEACWGYLDPVVAAAPEVLRKGPRGGGRDRDQIADHARGAERTLSCPKAGIRVPPRTPWGEQRTALAAALRAGAPGGTWPASYVIRRSAWHVLDHAWEIEDKST